MVQCPVCQAEVSASFINEHLDSSCKLLTPGKKRSSPPGSPTLSTAPSASQKKLKTGKSESRPLAERVRPQSFKSFVGHHDLVGPQGALKISIEQNICPSMILWGPPGSGKTTLARLVAKHISARFVEMSATVVGMQDCRKLFEEAKNLQHLTGQRTILFLDEIHRFAKNQQDVFLPCVENGTIALIGATTENPSFKVNNALLSRCRVYVLQKLAVDDMSEILKNAAETNAINVEPELLSYIAQVADGDARTALNILETVAHMSAAEHLARDDLKAAVSKAFFVYDSKGDAHYDSISALHKSIRGSDADASLYYLMRMLESGEDPLYIARRLVRVASEDIGTADSSMLTLATSTYLAVQQVGMPEADCMLAHCVTALAEAPKSVRVYRAMNRVKQLLKSDPVSAGAAVPLHLRNAPTKLMTDIGYGKGYKYPPNYRGPILQKYLPDILDDTKFLDTDLNLIEDSDVETENKQAFRETSIEYTFDDSLGKD